MDKYFSSAGMNCFNKQPQQFRRQDNQPDIPATSSGQFQPPLSKVQMVENGNYRKGSEQVIQQTHQMTSSNRQYVRMDAGVNFATDAVSFS